MNNNAHFTQQVNQLNSILTKITSYRDKPRIVADCSNLFRQYPALQPKTGLLPRANGTQTELLCLHGTVPIVYIGKQYNIPIAVWIIETYPHTPPLCYVNPTQNMIIKPKHKHVDLNGQCYLPYLSSWSAASSNVLGLVQTMCSVFSQDPPVRSQMTPNASPQSSPIQPVISSPAPIPMTTTNPYVQPPAPQTVSLQQDYNTIANNQSQQKISNLSSSPPEYENPTIVAKRNAIKKLTDKLIIRLTEYNKSTTSEIDELFEKQATLTKNTEKIQTNMDALQKEKDKIEENMKTLTQKFEEVCSWLEKNDKQEKDIDVDGLLQPKDLLSQQLLDLIAEDLAIEDVIYYMDKALRDGVIDITTFMKECRSLAREQFFKKALIKKVTEKRKSLALR